MEMSQTSESRWQATGWLRSLQISLRRSEMTGVLQLVLLATITAIGTLLRFFKLGDWSFWGDEVATFERSVNIFEQAIHHWSITRMLTYFSLRFFGLTEWAARLAPAIFGIAVIPVLFALARRIWGTRVAMIAAILMAVSTWHIYWSQNARFYSALMLFYTAGLLLFFLGIEQDRPKLLAASAILFGLAVQERILGLLFVPTIALYLLAVRWLGFGRPAGLRLRNLAIFGVPGVILAAGLLLVYPFVRQPSLWIEIYGRVNTDPVWILSGVIYYVGLPTIIMAGVAAYIQLRRRDRGALLLTLGAGIPLASVMAVSLFQYSANRYVFLSLPSWILLASVATKELMESASRSTRTLALGVLLILVLTPLSEDILYYGSQNGNRDDWKGALEYVESNMQVGDLVISANQGVGRYYLNGDVLGMESVDFETFEENGRRVWFVEDMNVEELYPSALEWIEAHAKLETVLDVHFRARNFKMRVYLYDPSFEQLRSAE